MEDIQQTQSSFETTEEPIEFDNSEVVSDEINAQDIVYQNFEGQSVEADPSQDLILGKFKSVEELTKAYEELQKKQGISSEELGHLRKNAASVEKMQKKLEQFASYKDSMTQYIENDKANFDKPEYFQNKEFCSLYKEAIFALGDNLDTAKFIDLLDGYVASRIVMNERAKSAQAETNRVIDSMSSYDENPKLSITPPKKHFDEMTPQEVEELIERLI